MGVYFAQGSLDRSVLLPANHMYHSGLVKVQTWNFGMPLGSNNAPSHVCMQAFRSGAASIQAGLPNPQGIVPGTQGPQQLGSDMQDGRSALPTHNQMPAQPLRHARVVSPATVDSIASPKASVDAQPAPASNKRSRPPVTFSLPVHTGPTMVRSCYNQVHAGHATLQLVWLNDAASMCKSGNVV